MELSPKKQALGSFFLFFGHQDSPLTQNVHIYIAKNMHHSAQLFYQTMFFLGIGEPSKQHHCPGQWACLGRTAWRPPSTTWWRTPRGRPGTPWPAGPWSTARGPRAPRTPSAGPSTAVLARKTLGHHCGWSLVVCSSFSNARRANLFVPGCLASQMPSLKNSLGREEALQKIHRMRIMDFHNIYFFEFWNSIY